MLSKLTEQTVSKFRQSFANDMKKNDVAFKLYTFLRTLLFYHQIIVNAAYVSYSQYCPNNALVTDKIVKFAVHVDMK